MLRACQVTVGAYNFTARQTINTIRGLKLFNRNLRVFVVIIVAGLIGLHSWVALAQTNRTAYRFFYHNKLFLTYGTAKGNGEISISDAAGNTLWLTTSQNLQDFYAKLLPQELDRLLAQPITYMDAGDWRGALKMFNERLTLLPRNPVIHYFMGVAFMQLGDFATARIHLKNAVQVSNDFE